MATYSLINAQSYVRNSGKQTNLVNSIVDINSSAGMLIALDGQFQRLGVRHIFTVGAYLQIISLAIAKNKTVPLLTRTEAINDLNNITQTFRSDLQSKDFIDGVRKSIASIYTKMTPAVRSYFMST